MFSLKRKIGHFHVLVVQNSQKNYKKSVKHLLPTEPIGFFLTFLLPSRRWMLKYLLYKRTHSSTLHKLHLDVSPLTDKFKKNESRRCIKIFQICQNHDAIIVFLQSKNKKLQKKKAKQETEIHKPKRKPTSLNRNTQPEKGAQIPIRQNIS